MTCNRIKEQRADGTHIVTSVRRFRSSLADMTTLTFSSSRMTIERRLTLAGVKLRKNDVVSSRRSITIDTTPTTLISDAIAGSTTHARKNGTSMSTSTWISMTTINTIVVVSLIVDVVGAGPSITKMKRVI